MSVTSTQDKVEVLQGHYEGLGKVSADDNFEAEWKEEVVSTLKICSSSSEVNEIGLWGSYLSMVVQEWCAY